jgi:hypothetical protein
LALFSIFAIVPLRARLNLPQAYGPHATARDSIAPDAARARPNWWLPFTGPPIGLQSAFSLDCLQDCNYVAGCCSDGVEPVHQLFHVCAFIQPHGLRRLIGHVDTRLREPAVAVGFEGEPIASAASPASRRRPRAVSRSIEIRRCVPPVPIPTRPVRSSPSKVGARNRRHCVTWWTTSMERLP